MPRKTLLSYFMDKKGKKSLKIPKRQSEASNGRTDNTLAKRQKDRQYIGQKTEGQTIHWPKDRRTDNTLAKRKRTKGQTIIYKTNPTKNQVLTQVTGNQFLVHFCHLSCYKWKLYTRGQTLDEGINDLYVTII